MTRRQVDVWLAPMRSALMSLKSGEVDCVDGYAVQEFDGAGHIRIDWMLVAWINCLTRLFPAADLSAMVTIKDRLVDNEFMTVGEVDAALRLLTSLERPLIRMPYAQVKSASLDEEIANEIDRLKLSCR